MSENTHTPGPWAVSKHDAIRHTFPVISGPAEYKHKRVAIVLAETNARLIAAAPELLEALDAIKRHWDSGNFSRCPELYEPMNAAIAKAKGTK